MALVKKVKIGLADRSGQGMDFECAISVKSDGSFSGTFPDYLIDFVRKIVNEKRRSGLFISQPRQSYKLDAPTMQEVIAVLKEALSMLNNTVIEKSLVIRFVLDSAVAYYLDEHGSVHFKGDDVKTPTGRWVSSERKDRNSGFSRHNCLSVGLFAAVVEKTTCSATGKTVYREHHFKNLPENKFGILLNDIRIMHHDEHGAYNEVPYTEETARVFVECVRAMCKVHSRLAEFMSSSEALTAAIKNANASALLSLIKGPLS